MNILGRSGLGLLMQLVQVHYLFLGGGSMEAIVMNEFESNWTLDHPLEGLRSSMVTVFFCGVLFGWEDNF